MREANKAILREKHPMPTLDDLISDLNGATVFSKLDLTQAYHQLELAEESLNMTTFTTHVGLRRYKRLMFGVNAAAEIFQNAVATILQNVPNCRNLSDDVIVWGKTQQEHDTALRTALQTLEESGAKENKDKCVISVNEITFYGHIFSSKGGQIQPKSLRSSTQNHHKTQVKSDRSSVWRSTWQGLFPTTPPSPNYSDN
jgi:hypothetical protein